MAQELDHFLDEEGQVRLVERRFVVEDVFAGFRLDHYLKRKIPRLSRTRLQEIIRTQLVAPRPMKASSSVQVGDQLVIRRAARPEPKCPRDIGVLHRDEHVLVIDKPAGLPVHASAKFYFNTVTRVLAETFPGEPLQIAHRLDRETSGALVVARGFTAASRLKTAFARKQAKKAYLAIVRGAPDFDTRDVDLPIAINDAPGALDVRMVPKDGAPPALTRVSRRSTPGIAASRSATGSGARLRATNTSAKRYSP